MCFVIAGCCPDVVLLSQSVSLGSPVSHYSNNHDTSFINTLFILLCSLGTGSTFSIIYVIYLAYLCRYLKPFQTSSQLDRDTVVCGAELQLPPFFLDTLIVATLQDKHMDTN